MKIGFCQIWFKCFKYFFKKILSTSTAKSYSTADNKGGVDTLVLLQAIFQKFGLELIKKTSKSSVCVERRALSSDMPIIIQPLIIRGSKQKEYLSKIRSNLFKNNLSK